MVSTLYTASTDRRMTRRTWRVHQFVHLFVRYKTCEQNIWCWCQLTQVVYGSMAWHNQRWVLRGEMSTSHETKIRSKSHSRQDIWRPICQILTKPGRHILLWVLIVSQRQYANDWFLLITNISVSFSFFLLWGGTRCLRMPALRPASQAGPMHNPREGTSAVLRDTIRLTSWCVWCVVVCDV